MAKILTSIHGRLVGLLANRSLSVKGLTRDEDAVVNVTTATLTVAPQLHAGKTLTLNRAAGITCTLPAATGSGDTYEFIVGTTFTGSGIVKVANATDTMTGSAVIAQDAADTMVQFDAVSGTSDTITFNGTTTGGLKGASIVVRDIKLDGTNAIWLVEVFSSATDTEATPFSATVS
jgi:hypothetical protein